MVALTSGLHRRPPYCTPPQQEDNQSAIVWVRGPLKRLQATSVETSGQN